MFAPFSLKTHYRCTDGFVCTFVCRPEFSVSNTWHVQKSFHKVHNDPNAKKRKTCNDNKTAENFGHINAFSSLFILVYMMFCFGLFLLWSVAFLVLAFLLLSPPRPPRPFLSPPSHPIFPSSSLLLFLLLLSRPPVLLNLLFRWHFSSFPIFIVLLCTEIPIMSFFILGISLQGNQHILACFQKRIQNSPAWPRWGSRKPHPTIRFWKPAKQTSLNGFMKKIGSRKKYD